MRQGDQHACRFRIAFCPFAPLLGWRLDSKQRVLNGALVFQVAIMLWLIGALIFTACPWPLSASCCLGCRRAVSPAKQGISRTRLLQRLGMAVGWLEMLTLRRF